MKRISAEISDSEISGSRDFSSSLRFGLRTRIQQPAGPAPLRTGSASQDGCCWRRSLVVQLFVPVARASLGDEVEEVPERLEGAHVTRVLVVVRRGVEEL